jgi:Tol biopolymer transport system component
MPLSVGTRLGPYEMIGAVGAGGMGEVYRARDTRLDRTVAVKILPDSLAADPHFQKRFEREARAISRLTHPHICTLYDVGEQDGTAFLVMELLEGETLADRLKKGALPLDQALKIAIQIADALNTAHRHSIVHRDLKPSNVMLTKAGAKLLDFGLAKASEPANAADGLSMLTTTSPNLTALGTILGTFQYMAPEQLEAKEADARSDIFAFGAVLREMLTGKKAFEGQTQASLIAAILDHDPPPVSSVQPLTPRSVDRIVAKCLAKNPDDRWQSAKDLHDELQWIADGGAQSGIPTPSRRGLLNSVRLSWSVAAVCLLAMVALAAATYLRRTPADERVYRTTILAPLNRDSNINSAAFLALSPDGRRIAFAGLDPDGRKLLYVRSVDGLTARSLPGSDGAAAPFWSPDSRFVAFIADNKLKKIDASGGAAPLVVCDVFAARPGAWSRNDVILFTAGPGGPLFRVPAAGGTPTAVTALDEKAGEIVHTFPFFLPDGRHFLYLAQASGAVPRGVYVSSLDSTERTRLLEQGSNAQYAQGSLLFLRGTTLMAQPFDVKGLAFTGEVEPVAAPVFVSESNTLGQQTGAFAVSDAGTLIYRADTSPGSQLVWFDRAGRQTAVLGDRARYEDVHLSPNGARVAVSVMEPGSARDLWVYDVARGVRDRVTFNPGDDIGARWSPDGRRLAFSSRRKGHLDLYQKASDGSGDEELLLADDLDKYAQGWSPDGRFILYLGIGADTGQDVWVLPLFGDRKPRPLLNARHSEGTPQFSPSGRWIAYRSNETGRFEVYVMPFPGPGGQQQISTEGGDFPRWRRDGKELVYLAADGKLMAVNVTTDGARVTKGTATPLFSPRRAGARSFYDMSADGQRFLVNAADSTAEITLVVNWAAGLKK